jgi:virginiamycin B lyase
MKNSTRARLAEAFDELTGHPHPSLQSTVMTGLRRRASESEPGLSLVAKSMAVAAAALLLVVLVAGLAMWSKHSLSTSIPGASGQPINTGLPGCVAPSAPKGTVPSSLVEYHVPELSSVGQVTSGPDGNLWFIGGSGGPPNGSTEVVGRITPSGQIKLYNLPGNPGESFDGIAAGPDGNIWFTEAAADKIGRLAPGTGRIDVFSVPLSPLLSAQRNTQTTDIVAGPDGNVWFNVDQIAGESVMPDGYVGRITPTGAIKLFAVPGGGQPEGIQVGADGNLWSRIAVSQDSSSCGAIPGYTPSAEVVRVTPAGGVTLLGEDSTQFAGYSVGPDGNYWWMTATGMMRRTTPSGQVKDFPAFTRLGFWDPAHFVFGPDNNIWYVDGSSIDRMTLAGDVTLYHAPGGNSGATSITAGPDGRLWFAEGDSGAATIGAFPPPTG